MNPLILVETRNKVGLIRFNRPEVHNALNEEVLIALTQALDAFEADPAIAVVVLAGSDKVFAAGADIGAMCDLQFVEAYRTDFVTRTWERLKTFRKPVIAAVNGVALGGGCELVMMCDIVFAADNARFGQPEIKVGTIPGAGGTQRLPRAIGKTKAMDLCLTGRLMDAQEAERSGLVARIFPPERVLDEALDTAAKIAEYSQPLLMMIKESLNRAFESSLNDGLLFERRMLHATFALADQKEGMRAFIEKRAPRFTDS